MRRLTEIEKIEMILWQKYWLLIKQQDANKAAVVLEIAQDLNINVSAAPWRKPLDFQYGRSIDDNF